MTAIGYMLPVVWTCLSVTWLCISIEMSFVALTSYMLPVVRGSLSVTKAGYSHPLEFPG